MKVHLVWIHWPLKCREKDYGIIVNKGPFLWINTPKRYTVVQFPKSAQEHMLLKCKVAFIILLLLDLLLMIIEYRMK